MTPKSSSLPVATHIASGLAAKLGEPAMESDDDVQSGHLIHDFNALNDLFGHSEDRLVVDTRGVFTGRVEDARVVRTSFHDTIFSDMTFENVDFVDVVFNGAEFRNCLFRRCEFVSCSIICTQFDDSLLSEVFLERCATTQMFLARCALNEVRVHHSVFEAFAIQGMSFSSSSLRVDEVFARGLPGRIATVRHTSSVSSALKELGVSLELRT